ncbi:MarR family transcriptional regulator [Azospirillum canadense]|uniref:MarR family transcriptional regulator n=1 Tax=Azospirillum canadense TaxID=403962 RepID=UPI002227F912|nr:MarR family transcriptional regulator [Azospirillum canadense]MCW2244162.1 DNA-binding MarR family transcriptional regulator [Azospirillum canadense]
MSELKKTAAKRTARAAKPEPAEAAETAPVNLLIDHMPLWARPGYLVRRLHQIHYALFFEECGDFDITPVQYGLLTSLAENPNIDQNSLGRELGIDRTNVADVLNRLGKRGLIERSRSTEDKRMVLTRLTPEGERITREMYGAMQKAQLRLLEPLLPEERNAFLTMLIRLVDGNNHLGRAIFRPT